MGQAVCRSLVNHFNLSQFGVNMKTLEPSASSGLRHCNTTSDEFISALSGTLTLISNDSETLLKEGNCVGFPAAEENGHMLINKSNTTASFLVVGSRVDGDEAVYPDDDFQWLVKPTGE